MNSEVFSVDDLLTMNTLMLGRGVPVQDDGIGYNKADYSICSNYYDGLSNAQIADLAKRLVKYSNTQLHIDEELMTKTAKYYQSLVKESDSRDFGVSVNVTEDETLIGFRYNEQFIEVIKAQPRRRFDKDTKQWVVPNENVLDALNSLAEVGADVENAIEYVKSHEFIKNPKVNKTDVLMALTDNSVCVKFDYNKDIIEEIKKIDRSARSYNPKHKYWSISKDYIKPLMRSLKDVANFKMVQ